MSKQIKVNKISLKQLNSLISLGFSVTIIGVADDKTNSGNSDAFGRNDYSDVHSDSRDVAANTIACDSSFKTLTKGVNNV